MSLFKFLLVLLDLIVKYLDNWVSEKKAQTSKNFTNYTIFRTSKNIFQKERKKRSFLTLHFYSLTLKKHFLWAFIKNYSKSYHKTTCCKKLVDFSRTSVHTGDTLLSSNKRASGNSCSVIKVSWSNSEQRSQSSPVQEIIKHQFKFLKIVHNEKENKPDRQARRRKAKAKFRAVLVPMRASPKILFWRSGEAISISLDLSLSSTLFKRLKHKNEKISIIQIGRQQSNKNRWHTLYLLQHPCTMSYSSQNFDDWCVLLRLKNGDKLQQPFAGDGRKK